MSDHVEEGSSQPRGELPASAFGEAGLLCERVGRRPRARALRISAVGVLVVVAILTAVVAASGVGFLAGRGRTTTQAIGALLAGIPQSGNALGSPAAPVTLQYFGDLQCPTAQGFTLGALPVIIRRWVRSGKLRIEYRSLRTVSKPNVFGIQQVAALAAGMQHKLWYYLEYFYHEQRREDSGYVTEGYLQGLARQVRGLKLGLWGEYRHDPLLAAQVAEDEHAAHAAGLHSTPSFLIGRTGSATSFRSLGRLSAYSAILDKTVLHAIRQAMPQLLHGQPDRRQQAQPAITAGSARSHQHAKRIAWHSDHQLIPCLTAQNTIDRSVKCDYESHDT